MRIDTHLTVTLMKKLVLKLDTLDVQSFETASSLRGLRCTVRGHMDDDNGGDGGGDYSDVCSAISICATWQTCDDAACVDEQRRIILYGS
jgi:hypothetical protein